MTSALDITRAANPPRAAFLDFPLGHTTGKPHDRELQRAILVAALAAFESLRAPGGIEHLPFDWGDEGWKRTAMVGGDARTPRDETPQYQSEDDRLRAAASCATCG